MTRDKGSKHFLQNLPTTADDYWMLLEECRLLAEGLATVIREPPTAEDAPIVPRQV